ncbi:uncharacterized protein [Blastocystis hominis]|uniref:Amino acid permease/ SLC12A domain-containing protein n=1 Tax=Blastocystis hominis TaxID=12968 RepID=D8M0Z2_BLAHO|nr:uncharacterized protein [Blastocystis hominis]CBK21731.2 unnamed protein product [Blastocystis hominis]|eukprot:XP_012895779.1 uncharacterized protein [Blastocystis hominis]
MNTFLSDHDTQAVRITVGAVTLLVVAIVAMIGAENYGKINRFLFLGQLVTIWLTFGCMLFRKAPYVRVSLSLLSPQELPHGGLFTGFSFATFKENFIPPTLNSSTLRSVFAVIFPAMTGIMEGANLSGDLENPGRDLGRGTIISVCTSLTHYTLLYTLSAFVFTHDTLVQNTDVFQDVGFSPYIAVVGIFIVGFSSALGSFIGGARVLQALARDRVFSFLGCFGKGYGKGDEPRIAILLMFSFCFVCLFIGGLETIAPIMTNFFCLSYALVNLSAFVLRITGAPNYRPRFKLCSWQVSLSGALLNFIIMFYINWAKALISVLVMVAIFIYLLYTTPRQEWGDISQSLIFHQARKMLLKLDLDKNHPKYWRPSILLYAPTPETFPLIDFCNVLKKGGLYVVGTVYQKDLTQENDEFYTLENFWSFFIGHCNVKAFSMVSFAPSAAEGLHNMVSTCGLGALRPNTIVIPLEKERSYGASSSVEILHRLKGMTDVDLPLVSVPLPSQLSDSDYYALINDVMVLQRNIVIAANYEKIQPHGTEICWPAMRDNYPNPKENTLDMVIVGDWDWHVEFSSRFGREE